MHYPTPSTYSTACPAYNPPCLPFLICQLLFRFVISPFLFPATSLPTIALLHRILINPPYLPQSYASKLPRVIFRIAKADCSREKRKIVSVAAIAILVIVGPLCFSNVDGKREKRSGDAIFTKEGREWKKLAKKLISSNTPGWRKMPSFKRKLVFPAL